MGIHAGKAHTQEINKSVRKLLSMDALVNFLLDCLTYSHKDRRTLFFVSLGTPSGIAGAEAASSK